MKDYETPKIEDIALGESDILTASNGTPLLPYDWFGENSNEREIF